MSTSTTEPAGRRPHRRLGREARTTQLLDVAAVLIAEGGLAAVTMEGVAARAGVDKRLTYTYFANRDDLLLHLVERELAESATRIGDAIAAASGLEAKLRASTEAWLDWLAERGPLLAELSRMRLPDKPEIEARQLERTGWTERFFTDLVLAELDVPEPVALQATTILLAGANGVVDLCTRDPRRRGDAVDTFITIAMAGLRALADGDG